MLQQPLPEDFVIATGETHSLLDFIAEAFATQVLNRRNHVEIDFALMRPTDLAVSRSDPSSRKPWLVGADTHAGCSMENYGGGTVQIRHNQQLMQ